MDAPVFTLSGIHLPAARDPLGLWSLDPAPAATFAAGEPEDDFLTWRVRLPDSVNAADRILESGLHTVAGKQAALRALDAAFPRMTPAVHWSPNEGVIDAELWKGVALARSVITKGPRAYAQGQALGDLLVQGQALLQRLQRLLTHLVWVETKRSDTVLGVTQVDWWGDFKTTWAADVSPDERVLHLKSVRLALASRLAMLQMVVVVIGGALTLAVRASVPGGQIFLIPVVYEYVQEILSAWARIRDAGEAG
jgi:hypothetical protein